MTILPIQIYSLFFTIMFTQIRRTNLLATLVSTVVTTVTTLSLHSTPAKTIVPQLFHNRFAYVSDIHAADPGHGAYWRPLPRILPVHGTLTICGDVGLPTDPRFDAFFRQIAPDFDRIMFVPGNHEYDCSSLFDRRKVNLYRPVMMDVLSRFSNVVVLDNDVVALDNNIKMVGTTLWSNVHLPPTSSKYLSKYVDSVIKHEEDVLWLEKTIHTINTNSNNQDQIIVLTHFPPTEKLISAKYRDTPAHKSRQFWSNLEDKIMYPGSTVIGCIAGHSHSDPAECKINGVDCRIHSKHW
jgi:hypothetical protein